MKLQKIVSAQGEWVKPGIDIKDGDKVTILDEGLETSGEFGKQVVFKIQTPTNGEKNLGMNRTTTNNMIDALGEDTTAWVGKRVNVTVIKAMVSGELKNVVYLYADGWRMDNKGRFQKVSGGGDQVGTISFDDEPEVDPTNF